MSRLILHIGPHKTGTSAIQRFCYQNWSALKKQGFHYAKAGIWEDFSHHAIYFSLQDCSDHVLKAVKQEISSLTEDEYYIISSEVLGLGIGKNFLNKFIDFVKSNFDEINLIVYARRQDHLAESIYRHWVKAPENGLKANPLIFYKSQKKLMALDIYDTIQNWVAEISPNNVIVRIYERGKAQDNTPLDFLTALGLQEDGFDLTNNTVNHSLDNNALAIIRALNTFPVDVGDRKKIRDILLYKIQKSNNKTSIFSPKFRNDIIKDYEDSNCQLAIKYLGSKTLFSEPLPDESQPWVDPLSNIDQKIIDESIGILFKHHDMVKLLFSQLFNSKIRNLN
ncbi:MAG: hypothetical protein KDK04_29480 [Candidatus Competibacteraceae bacterium]|nr:hypothetical protein [Candidatus Competibacteraceae bacterium]